MSKMTTAYADPSTPWGSVRFGARRSAVTCSPNFVGISVISAGLQVRACFRVMLPRIHASQKGICGQMCLQVLERLCLVSFNGSSISAAPRTGPSGVGGPDATSASSDVSTSPPGHAGAFPPPAHRSGDGRRCFMSHFQGTRGGMRYWRRRRCPHVLARGGGSRSSRCASAPKVRYIFSTSSDTIFPFGRME